MARQYDHIISLGSSCRPAYHIQNTFKISKAFPFDWWIFPLHSTVKFLEQPDLDVLYDPGLLQPYMEGAKKSSIVNTHYGIILHHEFPRDENGIVDDFRSYAADARSRTEFLMSRFDSLERESRILFVKQAGYHDPKSEEIWHECVERIDIALSSRHRFRNFDILLVNTPLRQPYGRVITEEFHDVGPDWRGDIGLWTERLAHVASWDNRTHPCSGSA